MSWVCVLLAAQGVIGLVQYETHLPSELVWVHVAAATLTWLCVLWSVAAAGRLEPSRVEGRRANSGFRIRKKYLNIRGAR